MPDTGSADFASDDAAVLSHTDTLEIGKEPAFANAGNMKANAALLLRPPAMRDSIASNRTFATDFAYLGHGDSSTKAREYPCFRSPTQAQN